MPAYRGQPIAATQLSALNRFPRPLDSVEASLTTYCYRHKRGSALAHNSPFNAAQPPVPQRRPISRYRA